MGGGGVVLAETTNFVFCVTYSTSCGFNFRGLLVRKLKQEMDAYGQRVVEWYLEPSGGWQMNDEEQGRFREAVDELESERGSIFSFKQMTKEQRTLSDIWQEFSDLKRAHANYKRRAEEAESAIATLHRLWDELKERSE